MEAAGGGALLGGLSGALANDKDRGKMTTAGNAFNLTSDQLGQQQNILRDTQGRIGAYGGDPTQQLQSNSTLGGLFGQGGTMDRTRQEEQDLSGQGFNLTPEDKTAYGQISGDITRQFGQSDQSLSQALSDRGLSNSGVAGAAFTGAQGNKMEQLAKAQQQIAKDRFNSNIQRLGQTRQFLGQLGSQAQSGINEQQQLGREQSSDYNQANQQRFNMANSILGNYQGQMNSELDQEQKTKHDSDTGNILNGAIGGAMSGAKMGSSMSSGGGMMGNSAGSSYGNGGMFA